MLNDFFHSRLNSLAAENRLRQLPQKISGVDFASNDYLGLARSEDLFDRIQLKINSERLKQNGATGSRLLSGNSYYTEEIEQKLARIFLSEATLIFNSGYSANLGVLSCIPQRGDTIIYDELAHTCIKDGARLSLAQRFSFKHNDLIDLENKLLRSKGKRFIAVESIYSMDGDQCPLIELVALAKKYDAFILLDEAHSTGVMGSNGNGLAASLNLQDKIDIRIYTFGKAMGCHGACVAGSENLIQYLINFARPFVYTTALPPHSISVIENAFDFLHDHIHLQKTLQKKTNLFINSTQHLKNKITSTSAIQTALFPGNKNVRKAAAMLQSKNFDVRPILSPTVPEGTERLRICLHAFNEDEDIVALAAQLKELHLAVN